MVLPTGQRKIRIRQVFGFDPQNIPHLERQGADIQSKVEELKTLNQSMMDRDKLKDDAIAHLSDQLMVLTARLDSIEKRQ